MARFLPAAAVAAAFMMGPADAPAQQPAPATSAVPVLSPTLERKIREARASGSWLVEEGENLYAIARRFAASEAEAAALAQELHAMNREAVNGTLEAPLRVGSRLRLPARLATAPEATLAPSTLPDKAAPHRADRAQPAAPGAPAYVDQLIGGAAAEEEERAEDAQPRDTTPGLRALALEYRLDRRVHSDTGLALSQGLAFRYAQETERHGDFTLEAEAGHERGFGPRGQGDRPVGRATLYHDRFALTGNALASSAIGAIRLGLSPWMGATSRVQLPSNTASGATTIVEMPQGEVRLGVGRVARLTGAAIQRLVRGEGTLALAEASWRIASGPRLGLGVVALNGSRTTPDHVAATFGAEMGSGNRRVQLQGLVDDHGGGGAWVDAAYPHGRIVHRFSAYQLSPDALFGDGSLPRDSRGGYWRGDYRDPRLASSFGLEATQFNLRRDPARGGITSVGGFATASLKLDRDTSVGGSASLREERPRTPAEISRRLVDLVSLFLARRFAWGASRWDATLNESRAPALPVERTRSLSWTHDWPAIASVQAGTTLTFADERAIDRTQRRSTASLTLRGPAFDRLNWDAAVTFVEIDSGPESQRNYNASLALDWSPDPAWVVRLQYLRNQIEPTAANPFTPFARENVVQLTARYEESAGVPYARVGGPGGRSGTGWIEGFVFFDENGDGVRQPTERGAPGVLVTLDGRGTQVTDNEGRYRFGIVATGAHAIAISVERVPLPWGLQDEAARAVRVEVREGARVDVPLTRIAP